MSNQEFPQIYPKAGWVEHNPLEILVAQLATARRALSRANAAPQDVAAIGIANQRETTVVWDRTSGAPIMNTLVWQDRRSAGICDELKARGLSDYVKENTGLVIWKLTGGQVHATDYSNAFRTMLPQPYPSSYLFGTTDESALWGARTPIAASIGDQQGALFGQTCFKPGMVKATYGTGGSLQMNTG